MERAATHPLQALKALETVPDLYLILSPDLYILTASTAYLKATFTQREAIQGRHVFEVFPDNPEVPSAYATRNLRASLQIVLATKQAHRMACQRYDVPGADNSFIQKYWLPTNTPVLNEQGQVDYIIHKVEDVTSQQQMEQDLQENQELLRTVFDAAPLSLTVYRILYDAAGQVEDFEIRIFNAFTERTTGLTNQQVAGKRYSQLFPHTLENGVLDRFKEVAGTGQVADFESWYQGEGMQHWFRFIVARQQDQLVVITEDITQQKKASQDLVDAIQDVSAANEAIQSTIRELGVANESLQRTNADLDSFVYTASHDLKAPISNIEGLLQALLRTLPPQCLASEQPQYIIAMMQESVERFKKTIASLTEVVKLQKETGGEPSLVNIASIVEEVLLDLATVAPYSAEQLEVDLSGCPVIRFSEKNLRSVVYNLLSNAWKYRNPGRALRVQMDCRSTQEYDVLRVKDNGLGMETTRLGQLFTLFKRFHTHVEGSGVGLYMVKKIVENAGGKIEVESQAGVGSIFQVYFPR
jgi:signal transduction histidine kinase